MNAQRHQRVKEVFYAASECEPDQRAAVLDRECGGDAALRQEVESLLGHLAAPVVDLDDGARQMRSMLESASGESMGASGERAPLVDRLGEYRILSVLGEGGMGVVYLAEQARPRRIVALKVMRTGAASRSMLRRFELETQVLGRLQHPGIAQIFEAGTADTGHGPQPYFAMEHVRGRSLIEYADQVGLDVRQRLALLVKVCQAIQHAHQHGVVHRDLKPGNILVDEAGGHAQPKILDFGIARSTNADVQATTMRTDVGQLVGTLPYMSPEQVSGDVSRIDARSDVYSLGVILFELLSGRLPHNLKGRSVPEAMRILESSEPATLSSVNRVFRGDLATIVAKALEREPSRRYQSALEFAQDLQRYLDDQPIVARPASALYQFSKFARRNRAIVSAMCLAMLGLMCAAVISVIFGLQAMTDRDVAETARQAEQSLRVLADQQSRQATLKADEAVWRAHLANIAAADAAVQVNDLSTAKRRLAKVDERHRGTWEFKYLSSRLDDSMHVLVQGGSPRRSVAISPDCQRLLATSWDGAVTIWDLAQDRASVEFKCHDGPVMDAQFDSTGGRIVTCSDDRTVRIIDAHTGGIIRILQGHTARVETCAFSPDGRLIASAGADRTVRLWNASTGATMHLLEGHTSPIAQVVFSPDGKTLVSASDDKSYRVWSVESGLCLRTVPCGSGQVCAAAFSPDGTLLATGHQKRDIQLWNVADWTLRSIIRGHDHSVQSICFSPDGARLLSGARDSTLRVWDIAKAREIRVLRGHTSEVQSVAWGADGWTIASSGNAGQVLLWDASIADSPDILVGHDRPTLALAFNADGSTLTSMADDGQIRFWDWRTGRTLGTLQGADSLPAAMITNAARTTIVTSTLDQRLQFINVDERRVFREMDGVGSNVSALAWSRDERWLAASGHNGELKVFDLQSDRVVLDQPRGGERVCGLAFTPDGTTLLVALNQQRLRWISTSTWTATRSVLVEGRLTLNLCVSNDGTIVAASDAGGMVWLFSVATGDRIGPGIRTPIAVAEMLFTCDDQRLVTSNSDGLLWFWDVDTRDEVLTLRNRTYPGYGLAFSPDGTVLAAGSIDVSIRLWETRPMAHHLQAIRKERLTHPKLLQDGQAGGT